MRQIELSIIIVNYNSSVDLRKCLFSIYKETQEINFEVIVIENASTVGTIDNVIKEFPEVILIKNTTNKGFAAANNQGIAIARGEFILLLNPDTIVLDRAIVKSIDFIRSNPQIGIVGCKLIFPDGKFQNSARNFPSIRSLFSEAFFLDRFINLTHNGTISKKNDWVMGAFFLVRKEVFDKIGLLDEQFFVYGEEMDFCYRAWESMYEVWYCSEAIVQHTWAGWNSPSCQSVVWSIGADLLFIDKHFKGVHRFLMKAIKLLGVTNRAIMYFLYGIVFRDKFFLHKAKYYYKALLYSHLACWKYNQGVQGLVYPWPQV